MDAASSQGSLRHVSFSVVVSCRFEWPQSHRVEVIWDQRQPIQSSFWPAWRVLKNWQKTGESESIAKYHFNHLQPISLNCQRLHECLQTSLSCSILFTLDWSRQTFDPWQCDGLMTSCVIELYWIGMNIYIYRYRYRYRYTVWCCVIIKV